jgi:HK97 gp10 family phage protein
MAIKTFKIEGLKELDDALGELKKATAANVMRRTLIEAGEPTVRAAKALAPYQFGHLQKSISIGPASPSKMTSTGRSAYDKKSTVEVIIEAGPDPQSITQEFGTVHHRPKPYMRPAWAATDKQVLNSIKAELWEQIRKAAERAAKKTARLAAR